VPQVFISYRRIDSAEQAARLASELQRHLGEDAVFFDIDSLRPGENFDTALERALSAAQIALVLIGPRWADELQRRLALPDRDFVRVEVAGALQGGLRVVPVLLGGAALPAAASLPEDLRALPRRQAFELPAAGWEARVDRLAESIGKPYRWGWLGARALTAVVLAVFALVGLNLPLATAQPAFLGVLVVYGMAEGGAAFWRWRDRRWRH